MPVRDTRRPLAALMAAGLALSLASALAACSGAPEERPAPAATATPATRSRSGRPRHASTATSTATPTTAATAAATPAPTPTSTATPTPTAEAAPAETPSATAFRYDRYDTTGEVAEPGSYAFLADPADTTSAVTTYEALRDGTTTALLIHKSDAHGASQAALYDAVEAGDLFEWHEAGDCFVRYKVTEVKPDPTGAVPRKLLTVEWMTFAFTGCSGAVPATAVATVDWGELPVPRGASLQVPTRAWDRPADVPPDCGRLGEAGRVIHDHFITASAGGLHDGPRRGAELDYWREPELPPGWRLARAFSGGVEGPPLGYCAHYLNAHGRLHLRLPGRAALRAAGGAHPDRPGF